MGEESQDERDLEERLLELVEEGIIDWNGKPLPPRRPVAKNESDTMISQLVSEQRR